MLIILCKGRNSGPSNPNETVNCLAYDLAVLVLAASHCSEIKTNIGRCCVQGSFQWPVAASSLDCHCNKSCSPLAAPCFHNCLNKSNEQQHSTRNFKTLSLSDGAQTNMQLLLLLNTYCFFLPFTLGKIAHIIYSILFYIHDARPICMFAQRSQVCHHRGRYRKYFHRAVRVQSLVHACSKAGNCPVQLFRHFR